jgi:hypothetical protein
LHGGIVVEVVDVETGTDAEVEVDEEVVVEVDVGTEVVGGTMVVEDEVDVVLGVGTVVDDVEVVDVDVAEVVVVDAEVEVVDAEVEVVDAEVEVVDAEVEVVEVEVDVVEVDVVEVEVVEVVVVEVDVVEVDVVEVVVVEVVVVEVDVVEVEVVVVEVEVVEVVVVEVDVVGTTLPPSTSLTLIWSATNVPRMVALERFRIAGFSSAQSWATTTVVVFTPNCRVGFLVKLHVVVASGTARPAVWPETASASWVPPSMLTAYCLPLTSTRRSCGVPPALICELGSTLKESTTSSTLGAAATTWLPLFVVTLQKT